MNFANIKMLFLIWIIPLFVLMILYGMNKRKKILSEFSSKKGLNAIIPDAGMTRRKIKAGLVLFSTLFIIFALTGPKVGYQWQKIEQKGVDIIIVMDCSRSMLANDIKPTRLDRAKREIYDLLGLLKGDRIGLVAFAGTAFMQCPLTIDYDAFHLFLNILSPDFLPVGGSDITGAVLTALEGFDKETSSDKAIILITDGENTGIGNPEKAAQKANDSGVKLFCIGVGKDEGVPVPNAEGGFKKDDSGNIVLTKLDEAVLKRIASITGGGYVRSVAGDMDLDFIYTKEIRGKMDQQTLTSGRKKIWDDRYQWPLAIALLALIIDVFLLPLSRRSGAFTIFFILILMSPPSFASNMEEGFKAYEKNDYESALKHFIDAQLENPEKHEIFYNIGNAYYKKGDFKSALNHFQKAAESDDQDLKQKAYYNSGNAHFRNGMLEQSIKDYEAALKIDPDDAHAKENIDFVKKKLEELKQQKSQSNEKSDKNDSKDVKENDLKTDGNKNERETKEKRSSEEDSGRPEYGKETEDEKSPGGDQQNSGQNVSPDQKEDQTEPELQAGAVEKKAGDNTQAEKMLNRLNDQPGKAMIPLYQEREIKKDW